MQKMRNSPASSAGIYLYLRQKSPYTCVKIRENRGYEMRLIKAIAKYTLIGLVVFLVGKVVLIAIGAVAAFVGAAFFVALISVLFGI